MCGVGGVRERVGIVAEEVAEVEGVGDGLGDINGSGLGNVSSWNFYYFFIRFFVPLVAGRESFNVRSSWLGLLRRIGR